MTIHDSPRETRRVTVTRIREGWEVLEEQNDRVIRRALLTDWHRVERAMGLHIAAASVSSSTFDRPEDK
jgi:hypothetical protein